MDRAYIEINIPNMVAVTLMAIGGMMLTALILKLGRTYGLGGGAAAE